MGKRALFDTLGEAESYLHQFDDELGAYQEDHPLPNDTDTTTLLVGSIAVMTHVDRAGYADAADQVGATKDVDLYVSEDVADQVAEMEYGARTSWLPAGGGVYVIGEDRSPLPEDLHWDETDLLPDGPTIDLVTKTAFSEDNGQMMQALDYERETGGVETLDYDHISVHLPTTELLSTLKQHQADTYDDLRQKQLERAEQYGGNPDYYLEKAAQYANTRDRHRQQAALLDSL